MVMMMKLLRMERSDYPKSPHQQRNIFMIEYDHPRLKRVSSNFTGFFLFCFQVCSSCPEISGHEEKFDVVLSRVLTQAKYY